MIRGVVDSLDTFFTQGVFIYSLYLEAGGVHRLRSVCFLVTCPGVLQWEEPMGGSGSNAESAH